MGQYKKKVFFVNPIMRKVAPLFIFEWIQFSERIRSSRNHEALLAKRVSLLSRRFMSPVTWPTEGVGPGSLLSASGIAA